jgi:HlyD family secretion protein
MQIRNYHLLIPIFFYLIACNKIPQVHLQRKEIIESVYASGKIIPQNEYNLFALSSGTILEKRVKDGDMVRKGQVLYVICNETASARLNAATDYYQNARFNQSDRSPLLKDLKLAMGNAEIRLKNDSLNYHRWKNLWEAGIGTRNNLDNCYAIWQMSLNQEKSAEEKYFSTLNDVRVNSSNALSLVVAARKDLNDYYIMANRDGVVYQTFKEAGEAVRNNELVALLGEDGKPLIRLSVDQEDIDKLKAGQQVLLRTDLSGKAIYRARVVQIYPTMNETDQTFRVDAAFEDKTPPAFIHCSAEANIIVQVKPGAKVLQREALIDEDSVWVLTGGRKKKIVIKTGISTLEYVEVLSGIDETTLVLMMSTNNSR